MKNLALADNSLPPLKAGTYSIQVKQTADELGDAETSGKSFQVGGPNFSFGAEEVHSVYPPDNMHGQYGTILPHVVFNRRTLPWEVPVKKEECPFLWLLLLSGEEVREVLTGTVGEAFMTKQDGVYIPEICAGKDELEEQCRYIDLDKELFLNLRPGEEELPYLCHVRRADGGAKQWKNDEAAEKEWYSVLFGNRLPGDSKEGVHNRVYILSYEGYQDETCSRLAGSGEYSAVRLLVLYSWQFYSWTNGLNMGGLFRALSTKKPAIEAKTGQERLDRILANGYIPMRHQLQNGDRSVSFYRGPLVPLPLEKKTPDALSAQELYKYDPNTGMFDISLAAAWQLGRLLTLSNTSIAEKIMKQRRKNGRSAQKRLTRGQLNDRIQAGEAEKEMKLGALLLDLLREGWEEKHEDMVPKE